MRAFVSAALLIVAVLGLSCKRSMPTSPTTSSPAPGIYGRVLDYRTQSGIQKAVVAFTFINRTEATTDASGGYTMPLLPLRKYTISVNGEPVGDGIMTTPTYRGDLFLDQGQTCVARYGTISDAVTSQPVAGATLSRSGPEAVTATTTADGWYRLDFGCPSTRHVGSNTSLLLVTHPNYANLQWVLGRPGVFGLKRLDLEVTPN